MLSDLQRSCGFGQGPRRRRKERRSPAVRAPPPWGTIPCPWLPTSLVLRPKALVRCSCREQTLARFSDPLSAAATRSAFFLLSFWRPLFLVRFFFILPSSALHLLFCSCMSFSSIFFILSFALAYHFHPSPSSSSIRCEHPPTQGWLSTRSKTNKTPKSSTSIGRGPKNWIQGVYIKGPGLRYEEMKWR